jgi:release factor glutamine methyltransferase
MTIRQSLEFALQRLEYLESSNLFSEHLLAAVLDASPTFLWGHPEHFLSEAQQNRFLSLVDRAAQHEPLAYLLGKTEFYGHDFVVTPDTLIPRPETEALVETVLQRIQSMNPVSQTTDSELIIVDVGTGSGCIAISLALALPRARVMAIDVSEAALEVARTNAVHLGAPNVSFLSGTLLAPLQDHAEPNSIDIIVANLPYISDGEFDQLPENVRNYEPELALRSYSPDPDALNKKLLIQSEAWLKPGGVLVYETTNGEAKIRN